MTPRTQGWVIVLLPQFRRIFAVCVKNKIVHRTFTSLKYQLTGSSREPKHARSNPQYKAGSQLISMGLQ